MPNKTKEPGTAQNFSHKLPVEVIQNNISRQLTNLDKLNTFKSSKGLHSIFQTPMDSMKALTCVVQGDVDTLLNLVKQNPRIIFHKGNITAPRGQMYYNVSPYMLIKFLCDEDMLAKVTPFISESNNEVRQAQDAEIGRGGSDIVKLDFDPMSLSKEEFHKLIEFTTNINVFGTPKNIKFSLLQNPNGILYWKDAHENVHFYYANRDTQTVIPITPVTTTVEDKQALNAFITSIDTMENNSARRSTNKEHQLITSLMNRTLHRQGVCYSTNGKDYQDSHTPFQLINHYRRSIRLYQEALNNRQWLQAHRYWTECVGGAQGEEMWLLQRLCEVNRPFTPLPQHFNEFERGFPFYNNRTHRIEPVFKDGHLMEGLGREFGLYKSRIREGAGMANSATFAASDLIAIHRLVEEAIMKTIGHANEPDYAAKPTVGS